MANKSAQTDDQQTKGVSKIIYEESMSNPSTKDTEEAVRDAMKGALAGEDIDPRLLKLFKEFKLYRVLVIVFLAIGFIVMIVTTWATDAGYIDEGTMTNLLIVSCIIVFAGLIISFTRARPIKEDISAWNKINQIAYKESNGAHGATTADIDKIFLSRARNKRVPPTKEFASVRHVWMALVAVAVALMVIAAYMAPKSMEDVTIPVVLIIISFVLLLIATYWDRAKMKPLREAWVREIDARVRQAEKTARKTKRKRK